MNDFLTGDCGQLFFFHVESCESFVNLSPIEMAYSTSYQRIQRIPYLFLHKIVTECAYKNFVNKVIIVSTHKTSFQENVKEILSSNTNHICSSINPKQHCENTPKQHHGCKNDNFQLIFFNYFHIFAQNIDHGYTLMIS